MKLVLVESPFMARHPDLGEARLGLLRNLTYARLAVRDCALLGQAAYASHLFFPQPLILDDDVPEERQLGIDAGLAWAAKADLTALYLDLGVSSGMRYGLVNAERAGRPVEERRIPGWEAALGEAPAETLIRLGLYGRDQLAAYALGLGQEGPFGPVPVDTGFGNALAAAPGR